MICNEPNEILAEIKKQMYLQNIQSQEIADKMGTSRQNFSNFFRQSSNPRLNTIFDIANALDMDIDFSLIKRK